MIQAVLLLLATTNPCGTYFQKPNWNGLTVRVFEEKGTYRTIWYRNGEAAYWGYLWRFDALTWGEDSRDITGYRSRTKWNFYAWGVNVMNTGFFVRSRR